jgi:hypothetical protein
MLGRGRLRPNRRLDFGVQRLLRTIMCDLVEKQPPPGLSLVPYRAVIAAGSQLWQHTGGAIRIGEASGRSFDLGRHPL